MHLWYNEKKRLASEKRLYIFPDFTHNMNLWQNEQAIMNGWGNSSGTG